MPAANPQSPREGICPLIDKAQRKYKSAKLDPFRNPRNGSNFTGYLQPLGLSSKLSGICYEVPTAFPEVQG